MSAKHIEANSEQVTFSVNNLRAIANKSIVALVNVVFLVSGIEFTVHGIQIRKVPGGGVSIHLPTFRDIDGNWSSAITMPDELRDALAEAILELLLEEGVITHKIAVA